MGIKKAFKNTARSVKNAVVNATTFIAAVFLYVRDHVSAFTKKNAKRFYKHIATLTQKHIIKVFLFLALAVIVLIAAIIVVPQIVP
ncbi:MAG: hypothetical protein IJL87_01330, partial [Clostridia bacterium]|nr:hypothetical protein [Clostridia bacterium]